MLLPNLIKDHGLILPDVCDFPDAGGSLFPEQIDFEPFQEKFNQSVSTLNLASFEKTYKQLYSSIFKQIKLDGKEKPIFNEMSKRIKLAADSYFTSCREQVERNDIPSNEVYEHLEEYGCYGYKVENNLIEQVNQLLRKDIEALQRIPDNRPGVHSYDRSKRYKKPEHPQLYKLVTAILKQNGALAALRKYNRNKKNIEVTGIAVHVSRPSDTHHFTTLEDMSTSSKLISCHMDPKYNLMKSIIYLDDVSLHNGPFTTIPGSNLWYQDRFERIVANGNSTSNYLNSPSHRRVLRLFPKIMRKNVIFGRYILDGTPMSDMLLSKLHPFTSDQADCIIFDPAHTIHRGGLCESGERINLQILMR